MLRVAARSLRVAAHQACATQAYATAAARQTPRLPFDSCFFGLGKNASYQAAKRALQEALAERNAVLSRMPPGSPAWIRAKKAQDQHVASAFIIYDEVVQALPLNTQPDDTPVKPIIDELTSKDITWDRSIDVCDYITEVQGRPLRVHMHADFPDSNLYSLVVGDEALFRFNDLPRNWKVSRNVTKSV